MNVPVCPIVFVGDWVEERAALYDPVYRPIPFDWQMFLIFIYRKYDRAWGSKHINLPRVRQKHEGVYWFICMAIVLLSYYSIPTRKLLFSYIEGTGNIMRERLADYNIPLENWPMAISSSATNSIDAIRHAVDRAMASPPDLNLALEVVGLEEEKCPIPARVPLRSVRLSDGRIAIYKVRPT